MKPAGGRDTSRERVPFKDFFDELENIIIIGNVGMADSGNNDTKLITNIETLNSHRVAVTSVH